LEGCSWLGLESDGCIISLSAFQPRGGFGRNLQAWSDKVTTSGNLCLSQHTLSCLSINTQLRMVICTRVLNHNSNDQIKQTKLFLMCICTLNTQVVVCVESSDDLSVKYSSSQMICLPSNQIIYQSSIWMIYIRRVWQ